MSITRRLFMRNSVALPVGLAAISAGATESALAKQQHEPLVFAEDRWPTMGHPVPTPQERLEAALRELKRAVKAIDPSISDWEISFATSDDLKFRFVAVASREAING